MAGGAEPLPLLQKRYHARDRVTKAMRTSLDALPTPLSIPPALATPRRTIDKISRLSMPFRRRK